MSALWAATDLVQPKSKKADTGQGASRRPRLRAVPDAPSRMARVPFLGVLIAVFGLGMAGLLMLNTTLQNQTFEASTLDRRVTELTYEEADLQGQLTGLAAPQELARRASAAGLRPNPHPAQLQLPSGKVVGTPAPVTGNEAPLLVVKTPAELAKEKAAAAAKKQAAAKQQAEALQLAAAARDKQLQAEQAQQIQKPTPSTSPSASTSTSPPSSPSNAQSATPKEGR